MSAPPTAIFPPPTYFKRLTSLQPIFIWLHGEPRPRPPLKLRDTLEELLQGEVMGTICLVKLVTNHTNADHRLLLQHLAKEKELQPSTCRMIDHIKDYCLIPPSSFKLSLEQYRRCHPKSNVLPYVPVATSRELKRSPKGQAGKWGLGMSGEETFCFECISLMMFNYGMPGSRTNFLGYHKHFHPLFMTANWIIAEERTRPNFPGLFRFHPALLFALERWKAVKLYEQVMLDGAKDFMIYDPENAGKSYEALVLGKDKRSSSLNKETAATTTTFGGRIIYPNLHHLRQEEDIA